MVLAGIDYSLCGPAVCLFNNPDGIFSHKYCSFFYLTNNKKQSEIRDSNIFGERLSDWSSDEQRYETIADWAIDIVMGCSGVALEGYSYGSMGKVFNIAENTGILKYKMYTLGIPVTIVAPTEVKKFATKKGNSDKNLMYSAFFEETGMDLKSIISPKKTDSVSPVSDIVDSYYICKFLYQAINKDI